MTFNGFNLGDAYGKIIISTEGIEDAVAKAQRAFDAGLSQIGAGLDKFGDSISNIGEGLGVLTAPIAAIGAYSGHSAIQFESAFAGIRKTVDATEEQFAALERQIRAMATDPTNPVAGLENAHVVLAQIGEAAGQLGVGQEYLEGFIETIAMLDMSTNLTADAAATMAAQFANIVNMDLSNIDRFGATIVALGNAGASTESEIMEFSMRIAAAGDQAKLTEAEILGISSTMASLGLNAEAGGTAMTRILNEMAMAAASSGRDMAEVEAELSELQFEREQAVRRLAAAQDQLNRATTESARLSATNAIERATRDISEYDAQIRAVSGSVGAASEELEMMARIAGVTSDQFRQLFANDASEALAIFLEGLGKMDQAAQLAALEFLKLDDIRVSDTLRRMSGNTELLREQLELAGIAWQENTALTAEAQARFETTEAQINLLRNQVRDLAIVIGNVMLPFINDLVAQLGPVIQRISQWVEANPELMKQIVQIAAVVVGMVPAFLGVGKAVSAVGSIFKGLGGVLSVLTAGPLGLLAAAVAALFVAFETNFLGIRDVVEPVLDWISDAFQLFITGDYKGGMMGVDEDHPLVDFILDIRETIVPIIEQVVESFGQFFAALEAGVPIGDALRVLLFNLFPPDVAAGIISAVATIGETVSNVFTTVVGFIQTVVLPGLGQLYNWFVTEALPAIVNFVQTVVLPGLQTFFNWLGQVWAVVGPALGELYNWFVNTALPGVVSFVETEILPRLQTFFDWLGQVWAAVQPGLNDLYVWFKEDALPAILTFVEEWVIPGIEAFRDALETIWTLVGPVLGSLANWFINDPNGLPGVRRWIVEEVQPKIDTFIQTLKNIWESVRPGLEPLFNWFNETFTKIKGFVEDLIKKIDELKGGLGAWEGISNNAAVIGDTLASGQVSIGDFFNAVGGAIAAEAGWRDSGGPGVAGMPYLIGRGAQPELFVPNTDGMFFPNADRLLASLSAAGGGGSTGTTFEAGSIVIHANSYEEGRAAAEGFEQRIQELRRRNG